MSESAVVRRFLYLGFAVCSIMLVVALSIGTEWRAGAAGTLVYGALAMAVYRQEQEREDNAERVRAAAGARTRGLVIADQDDEPEGKS